MLRGNTQWSRCMSLVILLEFFLFSAGSAMPTREEYCDQMVPRSPIAASPPLISNSPALQEVHLRLKDPSSSPITGLNLVRKFVTAFSKAQFDRGDANSPAENFGKTDSAFWNHEVDSKLKDLIKSRRFLNGAGHPRPYMWSANEQQQNDLQRRRAIESSSSPAEQTQHFLLSPPAPSSLVHNEKQDWNQDYAEPDVHPPSSN